MKTFKEFTEVIQNLYDSELKHSIANKTDIGKKCFRDGWDAAMRSQVEYPDETIMHIQSIVKAINENTKCGQ